MDRGDPMTRWLICLLALCLPVAAAADGCGALLDHQPRLLHSDQRLDLCQFRGRPLLVVNTASHCGYTPQFRQLEALYQRYRARGLVVLGVPSNDFRQEADEEGKTAAVCYVNYGVSFPMLAPQRASGADPEPIFRELAAQAGPPAWNFHKYLVGADGRVIAHFPSRVRPDDPELLLSVERTLAPEAR